MKRYQIAALLMWVVGWGVAPLAADRGHNLWQRAVTIAENNLNWVPGRVVSHIKMLTRKGRVKDHVETWLKLKEGEDTQIVVSLEKYVKNGVDETEKRKKRFLESRRKAEAERETHRGRRESQDGYTIGLQDHPFSPAVQEAVFYQLLETDISVEGKTCSLFSYRQKLAGPIDVVRTGKVWIEQESGIPVENQFTLEPLPSMVKRFTQRIFYRADSAVAWYPESLEIDGVGGFLFFRKCFQSRTVLENHFQRKNTN